MPTQRGMTFHSPGQKQTNTESGSPENSTSESTAPKGSAGPITPTNLGVAPPRRGTSHRKAAAKRLPASRWSYIPLTCGHFSTPELVEMTKCWQPKRGGIYCDTCGHWVKRTTPAKRQPIPDEPMF